LNTAQPPLRGHLHQHEDGALDGWCWAPDRPTDRLVVEVLVEDRVAVSMVAAMFRSDVLAQGCGDGCHGFALRLPPGLNAAGECLITARERRSRRVFGRAVRRFPGEPPGVARIAAVEADLAGAWSQAATLRARLAAPLPSTSARVALGQLAGQLTLRAGLRVCTPAPLHLPRPSSNPSLGIVLTPPDAATARQQLAALRPVLGTVDAEVLLADAGADPDTARLPAEARHLRYLRDPAASAPGEALALAEAGLRARWLILLAAAAPSGASVLALARALAGGAGGVVPADGEGPVLAMPAPLGLVLGAERTLLAECVPSGLGLPPSPGAAAAALALRLRLMGRPVLRVAEPHEPAASRCA
jgi:hypothetical protein